MSELLDRINAVRRKVTTTAIDGREGKAVILRRSYDSPAADVWNACTTPERLARWLAPVSGELRLGGAYRLEGNARGEVLACEEPTLLRVSWIYGEEVPDTPASEVTLRLTPEGEGGTLLELEHVAVVDPEFWDRYGPGAVGVGWDLALLGLAAHLDGTEAKEEREFVLGSAERWRGAHEASGADAAEAKRSADNTAAFYAPDPEES
ncbi:SRPBCC family protein [Streptomyces radicis]|uniref:SRPBCC family protein n=1 Tax=Streptomyces radicis TaxID=1750517 RepID=A0A3A9WG37_9ACTN|nr:SRPBCC family protein [Streptomyces radicis]RKN11998.1 SRPBCC family protein [Streptomyces radicis]RKN25951.1 SRPBCC family protein [Streptomyces radicis]